MNKLKKTLALIATLAIASSALVACGGSSSTTSPAQGGGDSSKSDDSSKPDDSKTDEGGLKDDGSQLSILCWTGDDVEKMIENFEGAKSDYKGKVKYVNVGSKGQEAREQYANYFAGSEDVDLFVLEADWILDYINNDEYTAPLEKLGLSADDFKNNYKYTVSIGTDNKGVLKAASWQSTPGAYVYRTDLAEQYLGAKTPAEMQEKVKDWAAFEASAAIVQEKSGGKTAMADTLAGLWQVYQYCRPNAWVDSSKKLVVDDYCKNYAELAKKYYDNGYVTKEDAWSDGWYAIGQDDSTLGYFFCTWCLGKGSMLSNAEGGEGGKTFGKYNITAGPAGWAWGGSWLALSPKCDNKTMAADFVKYFTVDEATMKDYALFKGEFVNNPNVMKKIVDEGSNKNDLLGGQDQFSILYEAASTINMDGKITEFDSQIKDAFNTAVMKYCKQEDGYKTLDEAMEAFKKEAAKIEGITVE